MLKIKFLIIISFLFFQKKETIFNRIEPPNGFQSVKTAENSFENYLKKLPLKPKNSLVKYYNGAIKANNNSEDYGIELITPEWTFQTTQLNKF